MARSHRSTESTSTAVARGPDCRAADHPAVPLRVVVDERALEYAAGIFRALGDPARLRLLTLLMVGPRCVTQLAAELNDNLPAVSQRLKLLKSERIVSSRRQGKHIFYSLDDEHIAQLISTGLSHAAEPVATTRSGVSSRRPTPARPSAE